MPVYFTACIVIRNASEWPDFSFYHLRTETKTTRRMSRRRKRGKRAGKCEGEMKMHFVSQIDNRFIKIKREEENIGFGWFIYVYNFQCKHKQQ